MKQFNFYKPLWKPPVLITGLMLTILLIAISVRAQDNPTKSDIDSDIDKVVGYIDDLFCCPPSDCVLIREDTSILIVPFQSLQNGDQIIVHKANRWIQLKLGKNLDPIRVLSTNSPYKIENNDAVPIPAVFFLKIKELFFYFKKLIGKSGRERNPDNCDSPTSSNGATTRKVGYKGLPLQKEEAQSIREAINNEPGLTPEAKNTLLAALLVMQQEGNWKQEASQLLNGIGTDYYPAVLVKKELDRTK